MFYDSDQTTRSVMTQTYSACESCRWAYRVHEQLLTLKEMEMRGGL